MNNPDVTNRRKVYFIEKSFQMMFILKFCALVVVGGLLTIGILYFLASHSTTVSLVDSRVVVRTTADFILPILIQTIALVTILVGLATIMVTLFISHKIAGPLYRFKKALKTLAEGDFSGEFRIRRFDQLQDLASVFNDMVFKVRTKIVNLKDKFSFLKEKLDNILEDEVVEHKRAYLTELKKISEELDKIISYFKT
ncbi:MAG: methyl-accepting chemotaxis protein [Candidatus Omnitrophica bacterium]|nr:methyl-accepting chemotaxis protein [Candidatus Omnitrophota bacterium]